MADRDDIRDEFAAGAVSMMPIIGPLLGPSAGRLSKAVRQEWRRNASKALDVAERVSGLSREDLAEAIAAEPRLVPLTTRVLYAAGMTGQDETLAALGTALGDAARDHREIDSIELLLGALADIRKQHIVVLRALSGTAPPLGLDSVPDDRQRVWTEANIPEHVALDEGITRLALSGLVNAGLVSMSSRISLLSYSITELGKTLLDVLATLDNVDD